MPASIWGELNENDAGFMRYKVFNLPAYREVITRALVRHTANEVAKDVA